MDSTNNPANASVEAQSQMKRDMDDSQKINHLQNPGLFEETGTHVKTMASGAADVGVGAAQGVVSLARGAALGAANIAQGAADAVKNTFGSNNPSNESAVPAASGNNPNVSGVNPSNVPSNMPSNVDKRN
ncbi:uncharacterized protein LOC127266078 [Andrographis paniculata]|uniref:uncharacterized protein LOC127266078 n=1 Tax=Andrographis paniculata TaxID=175694 RepID=UPI0021E9A244|nr:uncharacterized protein LOC127266078 [Andrographis paniculata]